MSFPLSITRHWRAALPQEEAEPAVVHETRREEPPETPEPGFRDRRRSRVHGLGDVGGAATVPAAAGAAPPTFAGAFGPALAKYDEGLEPRRACLKDAAVL